MLRFRNILLLLEQSTPTVDKALMQRAEQHFGTTDNAKEAGYILLNGKLLDVGMTWDSGQGTAPRHANVEQVIAHTNSPVQDFVNAGAIRISIWPNTWLRVQMAHKPTAAQMSRIRSIMEGMYFPQIVVDVAQATGRVKSHTFEADEIRQAINYMKREGL
jgi:hypothetical protein